MIVFVAIYIDRRISSGSGETETLSKGRRNKEISVK